MRAPRPVFRMPREIMMDTPISQMSGLAKLDSASLTAASGLSLVTPVTATSMMATIDSAPIGIALPIIAAITPTNIAKRCHACGVTPAGTGTANQISSANPTATAAGSGLKPSLSIRELLFLLGWRTRNGAGGKKRDRRTIRLPCRFCNRITKKCG